MRGIEPPGPEIDGARPARRRCRREYSTRLRPAHQRNHRRFAEAVPLGSIWPACAYGHAASAGQAEERRCGAHDRVEIGMLRHEAEGLARRMPGRHKAIGGSPGRRGCISNGNRAIPGHARDGTHDVGGIEEPVPVPMLDGEIIAARDSG